MFLNIDDIQNLFASKTNQWEVLAALYKMVFPYWDQITELNGYPEINSNTWDDIADFFIAFDRIHHPDVIPGGSWVNKGFAIDDSLLNGEVSTQNCIVTLIPNVVLEMEE